MINLINNIISNSGYQRVDFGLDEPGFMIMLFKASDESKQEYFLSLQAEEQENEVAILLLEEKAQIIFEKIRNSGKTERFFEKNCTMIVCHEAMKIKKETIFSLEEDPYNFKKNVLTYSTGELLALQTYLSDNKIEKITNDVINNILNSNGGKNFLEFKQSTTKGLYSIVLKTTLKLPFLIYTPQEQKLSNLALDIENNLTTNLNSVYKKLISLETEWDDDNILDEVTKIWSVEP
ncbi:MULTISPECIES: ABC-three component system middle component 1 [unclassified Pseudomonas]|uniref:ABC-three component system middle component 1 n=1 Tax=unclassified Pseudomonas TaxID=196821 RepID=UPI000A1EA6DE|nr:MULTISPECIES: ABC-three component system middle component 1 [unclassified Pseudomonas]